MKFKYSEYQDDKGRKIYRPSVPITFKYKSKFIQTTAIIDSGADFNILPIEMAGILGIKLEPKTKISFQGAGSNNFPVYSSRVKKVQNYLRWQAKRVGNYLNIKKIR